MTRNESIAQRAQQVLTPNYRQQPVAIARGEGVRVWDADGNEYLDFLGGVAVDALGHCHPALVKALEEQARTVWHVSNHYYIPRQVELAEALLAVTPWASRAFFCNSGGEANEAVLKLARKFHHDRGHPERNVIVSCHDSFHGRSLFTVTVGGQPKYQAGFAPLVPGVRHVKYGDLAALEAALDDTVAAFMVEPIMGESGVVPPPEGYLRAVRELTRKKGVLLCLDEVQTGMGRTGKFWAHEWEGITPDLMSSAKALGGGFPIGAMLATEEVGQHLTPGSHGTTYGGNPLACAVALAVLAELRGGVLERSREVAARLRAGLEALASGGRVARVRGRGMLLGVIVQGVAAAEVMKAARAQGLLVNAIGDDVLRLAPPLTLTAAEADLAVERLGAALAAAPAKP
ncbi:acetylornithine and succinylornithine aminotransferase [Anaeromyxobacter dehalogenans 2CP-1]|uniref:Acetylornithine aminotransferase n=1 Tax=Anaeromyxobacter dehalogenans (strain ATCC BAA-258 / DSM 21875 / 2CP-1) TaxID=455488 RepID=B8JER9_ANAD2|nr:acetylornithine transaminase [Anaeromyxobacter dehalogenans]ACL66215.1 acetylornithine and succinylornithine aminotransferase [Anaeromyxobacter dehalogenans 2CP-1]